MNNALRSLATLPALIALVWLQGCASEGHDKANDTATKMSSLRSAIVATKDQVNAVSASLTELTKENVDSKTAFGQFTKSTDKLADETKKTTEILRDLRAQGAAYFAEWQKQNAAITDPDIKKAADERRADLTKSLEGVTKSMDEAAALYPPYLSRIQDAKTFMSNDLTKNGIKTISSTLEHLVKEGGEVSKALDSVVKNLDATIPAFQAAKPPPPPPPAAK
jgi:chromosome segregation ATPase